MGTSENEKDFHSYYLDNEARYSNRPRDSIEVVLEEQPLESVKKMTKPKRAAIIGAGVVGITTGKCCLDEEIDIVIYERSNYTGGLWRYQGEKSMEVVEDGTATVMHSTVINSSKEVSAFSDFPPPAEYPNFMHNSLMMKYIDSYACRFNVNAYIQLRHEVLEAKPEYKDAEGFKWLVTVHNLVTGLVTTDSFDALYICTGHHGIKSMPEPIEGQDKFEGKILHAHDVRSGRALEGQRVVIVGLGNSGADLAAELAPIGHQTYVALRRGAWITNRVGLFGLPIDHFFLRRVVALLFCLLPYSIFCRFCEKFLNFRFDHARYRLKPEHRFLSQNFTVNDALPNLIISGRVKICSSISRFTTRGVVFEDEPGKVVEVDTVIFATGYKISFPFLPPSLVNFQSNRLPLYKFIFSTALPSQYAHTLAFVGLVQPLGPIMPMAELQARWVTRLLTERCARLPTTEAKERDITRKYQVMERFYASERHTVSFDWIPYMDEVAELIGCRPPVARYMFTDNRLWRSLFFGCAGAYQYRLVGPGTWKEAREAILGIGERIERPFATRLTEKERCKAKNNTSPWFGCYYRKHFIVYIALMFFILYIFLRLSHYFRIH